MKFFRVALMGKKMKLLLVLLASVRVAKVGKIRKRVHILKGPTLLLMAYAHCLHPIWLVGSSFILRMGVTMKTDGSQFLSMLL